MKTFTVADSEHTLARHHGTEIMASGFEEARDKAEALGVPCRKLNRHGDGAYAISDGREVREMECGFVVPVDIEFLSGESLPSTLL